MFPRTIHLLGEPIRKELTAGAAIKPGLIVERTSTGTAVLQSTDGLACQLSVAFEDEIQGKGIRDEYAIGDVVQINYYKRGDAFYGRLLDGQVIVQGDKITPTTGGLVKKLTNPATEALIAIALEAVDMSGSAGADPEGFIALETA